MFFSLSHLIHQNITSTFARTILGLPIQRVGRAVVTLRREILGNAANTVPSIKDGLEKYGMAEGGRKMINEGDVCRTACDKKGRVCDLEK